MPDGFGVCWLEARVGDIVHGGVAMLELRGPNGDGRTGV